MQRKTYNKFWRPAQLPTFFELSAGEVLLNAEQWNRQYVIWTQDRKQLTATRKNIWRCLPSLGISDAAWMIFIHDLQKSNAHPRTPIYLSVCLPVSLSVCLSVRPSVCLSVCLSARISVYPSVRLSVYLSTCLSIYRFTYRSICRSIDLPIFLTI